MWNSDSLALKLVLCCIEQQITVYLSDSAFDSLSVCASSADCVDSVWVLCTCGWESMSRLQEHILPSVDTVIKLLAFWVPTTFTQYTGCCTHTKRDKDTQNGGHGWRYALSQYKEWCFQYDNDMTTTNAPVNLSTSGILDNRILGSFHHIFT